MTNIYIHTAFLLYSVPGRRKHCIGRIDFIQDIEYTRKWCSRAPMHRTTIENRSKYTPGIATQRAQHKAKRQTVYSRGHKHPNMSEKKGGGGGDISTTPCAVHRTLPPFPCHVMQLRETPPRWAFCDTYTHLYYTLENAENIKDRKYKRYVREEEKKKKKRLRDNDHGRVTRHVLLIEWVDHQHCRQQQRDQGREEESGEGLTS